MVTCTWMLAVVLAQTTPPPGDAGTGDGALTVPATRMAADVPASIDVTSQLGKRYRFVEADVMIDGVAQAHQEAAKGQELARTLRVFEGPVSPGPHQVTVMLTYAGRNTGPFTYLGDYRYIVNASASFEAFPGQRPAALDVVAKERTGITVPVEEKPTAEFRTAPNSSAVLVAAGRVVTPR
jgi:hypothetical protein